MTMTRSVVPEELDSLGPDDPAAIRSRGDLQRIHRAMGSCRWLTHELNELAQVMSQRAASNAPLRVLELGAGDGSLMLRVAKSLKPKWPQVRLSLLDQVDLLSKDTRAAYAGLGWQATPLVMNVFDWLRQVNESIPLAANVTSGADGRQPWDLIIANLFLHHFEPADLRALLAAAAQSCKVLVALEPRRSRFALAASHCVGALGACKVTRLDAVASVRAGFAGQELSALWPINRDEWLLSERFAAPFSHCFVAQRKTSREASLPSDSS